MAHLGPVFVIPGMPLLGLLLGWALVAPFLAAKNETRIHGRENSKTYAFIYVHIYLYRKYLNTL